MEKRSSKYNWFVVAALFVWGGLIYSNSLAVPFYLDDAANITENRSLRIDEISMKNLFGAGIESRLPDRPFANITFALNNYFHGDGVTGYHLVNVAVHILCAIVLFFFISTLLALERTRNKEQDPLPFSFIVLATFLWFVHPIQTQSVTYIVQRMNSLSALFFVFSLLCYVRGRLAQDLKKRIIWFCLCACSAILAVSSKEIAVTIPFYLFIIEWYFFQDLRFAWIRKSSLWIALVAGLIVAAVIFYLGKNPLQGILATYAGRDFTLAERVLTEFRVVVHYISLLLFPHPSRLSLEYDFLISKSLLTPPSTLPAILALAGLFILAIYFAKKERIISFCIIWYLGNLVIESSVIGLEIIFEHRNYLPSMLFFVPILLLLNRHIKKKVIVVAVISLVVAVFSFWTFERNSTWRDPIAFWRDCISKAPGNPRPYSNLGLVLNEKGKTREAVAYFLEALKLNPNFLEAHNNLGISFQKMGRLDEASKHFLHAVRLGPGSAKAHNNLGNVLARKGDLYQAERYLRQALALDPEYAEAHNNLGNVLQIQGRYHDAVEHYRAALRLRPDYEDARYNMGIALRKLGR